MIKKLILISILCTILFSCGKKDDPVYKAIKKVTKITEYVMIFLDEIDFPWRLETSDDIIKEI